MKKKKWLRLLWVLGISCFAVFTACTGPDPYKTYTPVITGTYESYAAMEKGQSQAAILGPPDTLEELQEHSDIIVQGFLQDDAKNEITNKDGFITGGSTTSTLYITKVLRGASGISPASNLTIYEPYYVHTIAGESHLVYISHYLPAEPGKEYIFFLTRNQYGNYVVDCFENSRFPLPDAQTRSGAEIDALTAEDLYLAEGVDLEGYKALYREVLEAYAE